MCVSGRGCRIPLLSAHPRLKGGGGDGQSGGDESHEDGGLHFCDFEIKIIIKTSFESYERLRLNLKRIVSELLCWMDDVVALRRPEDMEHGRLRDDFIHTESIPQNSPFFFNLR